MSSPYMYVLPKKIKAVGSAIFPVDRGSGHLSPAGSKLDCLYQ